MLRQESSKQCSPTIHGHHVVAAANQTSMCDLLSSSKSLFFVAVTAGDGNCGYRAVVAGLIESAQKSAQLKEHLLQKLPELMGTVSTLEAVQRLGTSYAMHLQHGYDHLMVSHQGSTCVAPLHAFTPIALWYVVNLVLQFCAKGCLYTRDVSKVVYITLADT